VKGKKSGREGEEKGRGRELYPNIY